MTQQQTQQPRVALFADVFEVSTAPFGARLSFGVRRQLSPQPGQQPQQMADMTQEVYMSMDHLKAMVFVLAREMGVFEKRIGQEIDLPDSIVASLVFKDLKAMPDANDPVVRLAREEWNRFWRNTTQSQQSGDGKVATVPSL